MTRLIITFFILIFLQTTAFAQQPVSVGKGSYASYPPLYKSHSKDHAGDQTQKVINQKIYVTDEMKGQPIPTNDWWTDLLVSEFSGNLWAYPIVVNAEEYGLFVEFPKHWTGDGCEMKSASQLKLMGKQFRPECANVSGWHDWGVEFLMKDDEKAMRVTLAHGMPFTWIETTNLSFRIPLKEFDVYQNDEKVTLPQQTDRLAVRIGEDVYGLYTPENTEFISKNGYLEILLPASDSYLAIGVLPDKNALEEFARYAYSIPRSTKVTWNYDEDRGKLSTEWEIVTENLNGNKNNKVLQGFIPHHYKYSEFDFSFAPYAYDTPRGKMKMAEGSRFTINYDFNGILPYWPIPQEDNSQKNPYDYERMKYMIEEYANKGNFGGDTYWGGKGLIQMALYMTFAHEMGEIELFERCKDRLREVLIDWFTFTPGEQSMFFARYDTWKALVGYDTSYDSETFNDHHFHYGYFTYAAALLALFDDEFKNDYGQMAVLLAKEYANWDRADEDYPFFRTFDPWAGHSYAGGFGGWNGNGQESSSEAMQSWGGLYTLGLALDDKEMRDAGIFGWLLESRGVAEYWFDRDRENIDYTRYTRPYNSNLTSQGIGWWTWFSGDPVWMHSIQWLPISPLLCYLYQDLDFARWEYTEMWKSKEIDGWLTTPSESALSNESGLGNVVLSYLQIFDTDSAASVLDRMWEYEMPVVKAPDTGGISYYATHSHRTYGDIQWDVYGDMPSSTCYLNALSNTYTYVVYNPGKAEKECRFYKDGKVVAGFLAAPRKLTVYNEFPYLTDIIINSLSQIVEPGSTLQLTAQPLSQYETTLENVKIEWQVIGDGQISETGLFTASTQKGETIVQVKAGAITKEYPLIINDKPVLEKGTILPEVSYLIPGKEVDFYLEMMDQYGLEYRTSVNWEIRKDGVSVKQDSLFNLTTIGEYTVVGKADGKEFRHSFILIPDYINIALNKPAYASSLESPGMSASYATDGNIATRWGSEHSDPQWIYVDLQESCYVGYIHLIWESSYASLYEIQVSENARDWQTIKRVTGAGGNEKVDVNTSTRYVRMYGLERVSVFGYSLYEFEIYGVPSSTNPDEVFVVQILPDFIDAKEEDHVQLSATAYNSRGEEIGIPVQWALVSGKGRITSLGMFTPLQSGEITLGVSAANVKVEKTYLIEESFKLNSVEIYPNIVSLIKGRSQVFTITAKDQFDTDFRVEDIEYTIKGGSASFKDQVFTADKTGEYILIAGKGEIKDTAYICVDEIENINLALNKPTYASGSENDGLKPSYATDGDFETRWGSLFEDNEYLDIDLQAPFVIHKVHLYWQTYATSYRIEVSLDDEEWTTVYTNLLGYGGEEEIEFDAVAARYVRIYCMTRNTDFGASLWEVEIYGTKEWVDAVPTSLIVHPDPLAFYLGENGALDITLLDQYGLPLILEEEINLEVNGGGAFDNQNKFHPTETGDFILTVTYKGFVEHVPFKVYPAKEFTHLVINPDYYKIKVGEILALEVKTMDQYGNELSGLEIEWKSNGGAIDKENKFVSQEVGTFLVTAVSQGRTTFATIEVIEIDAENIAYRKPVEASSEAEGAVYAVDGNSGTRWQSLVQDGAEWLKIDLLNAYYITDVEIDWETASAAAYKIQTSTDGVIWKDIEEVQGKSGERTDKFRVTGLGRYLRIYCTRRSTEWGYSIYEIRVYGALMKTGEPYSMEWTDKVARIKAGENMDFSVQVEDMQGNIVNDYSIVWTVSGGGVITQEGNFMAYSIGEYEISASCGLVMEKTPILVYSSWNDIDVIRETPLYERKGNKLYVYANGIQMMQLYDVSGRMVKIGGLYNENEGIIEINGQKGFFILIVKTSRGVYSFKMLL